MRAININGEFSRSISGRMNIFGGNALNALIIFTFIELEVKMAVEGIFGVVESEVYEGG